MPRVRFIKLNNEGKIGGCINGIDELLLVVTQIFNVRLLQMNQGLISKVTKVNQRS